LIIRSLEEMSKSSKKGIDIHNSLSTDDTSITKRYFSHINQFLNSTYSLDKMDLGGMNAEDAIVILQVDIFIRIVKTSLKLYTYLISRVKCAQQHVTSTQTKENLVLI
jgi:hypothetical protein